MIQVGMKHKESVEVTWEMTAVVQYRETNTNEFVAALSAGTIDVGDMSGSKSNYEEIASYNSNGDINGDVVNTIKVDNLGYGYIGMNADTMNVGGEPGSEASSKIGRASCRERV